MRRIPVPFILAATFAGGCSLNHDTTCNEPGCSASVGLEDSGEFVTDTDGSDFPPFWPGVTCPPDPDTTPQVYFDLRAGKDPDRDFFRLPFPLDARRRGNGLDLDGFPRPPDEFALAPELAALVERWFAHIEYDTPGFAVNGTVYFRSSTGFRTLEGIHYLNITPGHPDYGAKISGLRYNARNSRNNTNNYLCGNSLVISLWDGVVLDPGATYAVILTSKMKPHDGEAFVTPPDFKAMLQSASPTDATLAAAWSSFAPLRAYLNSPTNNGAIAQHEIIGATVFTTAPQREILSTARAAVHAGPLAVKDWYPCTAAGDSPCSSVPGLTAEERAVRRCSAPQPTFTEYQGRVTAPIFQEGKAPYARHGGKIQVGPSGPRLHAVEDVCFALTLPAGEPPEAGWPTLIFAHGTGGNFRNPVNDGFAAQAAQAGMATLTLEGLLHGQRRGDDDEDGLVDGMPLDQLVFNLNNPDAARDNLLQAAIDQFTAVRLAKNLQAASNPEPAPGHLDPDNLFFFGHSQGAQAGVLFLPYEPDIRAAALSGVGSNLLVSLLAKSEPKVVLPTGAYPPRELLQLALQEHPGEPLTTTHPLLNLMNIFVNRSDGDVYSRLLRRDPNPEVGPKHVLMYLGYVDNYTPARSAANLAAGVGMSVGGSSLFPPPCSQHPDDERQVCELSDLGILPVASLPLSGNRSGDTSVLLMRQKGSASDGHFVAYTPAEQARIVQFMASARDGATPVVQ